VVASNNNVIEKECRDPQIRLFIVLSVD